MTTPDADAVGGLIDVRPPEGQAMTSAPRRLIRHLDTEHLDGDPCRHCHSVARAVERSSVGGYVLLEAMAVHAHACPNWRTGKRHGPCDCGANDLWDKHRGAMTDTIYGQAKP